MLADTVQELTQQLAEDSQARQDLQAAHASLGQEHAMAEARAALLSTERDSLAALLRSYEHTGDRPGDLLLESWERWHVL